MAKEDRDGPSIAVVGAGIAGAAAARALTERGFRVQVYEKSRGPGGRLSTRREGPLLFDHGAQYFTVRDPRFEACVDRWRDKGLVGLWRPRVAVVEGGTHRSPKDLEPLFVGIPGMNAPVKELLEGVAFDSGDRVERLARVAGGFQPEFEDGEIGPVFDAVVVAIPAEQAAVLLAPSPELASRASLSRTAPCWSVMAAFRTPIPVEFDALFLRGGVLSWAARMGSKPGRPAVEAWVLHASTAWSRTMLERSAAEVEMALLTAFFAEVEVALPEPTHIAAHRWRYAFCDEEQADGCLFDPALRLGACGDWCIAARVESAFLSGLAVAEKVTTSLG